MNSTSGDGHRSHAAEGGEAYLLDNGTLRVVVSSKGAELHSIYSAATGLEYLWSGDPAFWAKRSPVLFPIVGALKDGTYYFEGKAYQMGRHGFARELPFSLLNQGDNLLEMQLESNEETLRSYPFPFALRIRYVLDGDVLAVTYMVDNGGNTPMYFSIGGHPAFKVPLTPDSTFEDHYLEFEQAEQAGRWPVTAPGLIGTTPAPMLHQQATLPLTHELFRADAIVFKHLRSAGVRLGSHSSHHGVSCRFEGFPYLGIWSIDTAGFVCIEPWCGIADSVDADQQLVSKEGINKLGPGATFTRTWTARFE